MEGKIYYIEKKKILGDKNFFFVSLSLLVFIKRESLHNLPGADSDL